MCVLCCTLTPDRPTNQPYAQRLLVARDTDAVVRKKAALCLLKLFRTNPDNVTHSEWAPQVCTYVLACSGLSLCFV